MHVDEQQTGEIMASTGGGQRQVEETELRWSTQKGENPVLKYYLSLPSSNVEPFFFYIKVESDEEIYHFADIPTHSSSKSLLSLFLWPRALSAEELRAGWGTNIREHNETTMCPQRGKHKTCSEDLAILSSQMCLLFTAFNLRAGSASRLTARQEDWQVQWYEPSDGGSGGWGSRWATLCWLLLKKGRTQLI